MKKRKRQKNNRVLRKISHILLIAALFHYVPAFLRQSGMPYTETVYRWIVTYIYNGVPGIVLRPLCQWFWSLEWYPFIYFLTGAPSVLLFIAVRFQILLKGRIYETKKRKRPYRSFRSGGGYSGDITPLFWKIKERLRSCFLRCDRDMVQEAEQMALCRIISGNREFCEDMAKVRLWHITEQMQILYDGKTRQMTVIMPQEQRRVLEKGQAMETGGIYIAYM